MSKPALGRGLGKLLNGDQVAGVESPHPASSTDLAGLPKTPGVQMLFQGRPIRSEQSPGVRRSAAIPGWFWFGLDLALLAGAECVLLFRPAPVTVPEILFLGLMVATGCLAGLSGVLRN